MTCYNDDTELILKVINLINLRFMDVEDDNKKKILNLLLIELLLELI